MVLHLLAVSPVRPPPVSSDGLGGSDRNLPQRWTSEMTRTNRTSGRMNGVTGRRSGGFTDGETGGCTEDQ